MECVDLRPWARANDFRWRFEKSYAAESPELRGDGRWYVEIVCERGLIYPYGGTALVAYAADPQAASRLARLEGVSHHQWDDRARAFLVPAERLEEVAAILRPRKRPGSKRARPPK